jgi:hypothetical protein
MSRRASTDEGISTWPEANTPTFLGSEPGASVPWLIRSQSSASITACTSGHVWERLDAFARICRAAVGSDL